MCKVCCLVFAIAFDANEANQASHRLDPPNPLLCSRRRRIGKDHLPRKKHAAAVSIHKHEQLALGQPLTTSSTVETFQGYLRPVTNAIRNPSSLQKVAGAADSQNLLSRVRNLDGDTLVGAGIVAAEVLGFFCIGEMIGRFKVVGYRGGNGGHGEHH